MSMIAGALLAAALSSAPALAFERGDWVLGRYQGGPYWFPGVVQGTDGNSVMILYDDGDSETLPVRRVRPYDWRVGSRVECNYKGAGAWYPGVITQLENDTLRVNYDDGDRERTKTVRCRSR